VYECVDWIHLAQDRERCRALANTIMNLKGSVKCGECLDQLSDRRFSEEDSSVKCAEVDMPETGGQLRIWFRHIV
jgi:hypothetical protein